MSKFLVVILLLSSFLGCKEQAKESEVKKSDKNLTSFWLRSPESILGTVRDSWEIPITAEQEWELVYSVYGTIGGLLVTGMKASNFRPNGPYVMAIDRISQWISVNILDVQKQKQESGQEYIFSGFGLDEKSDLSCFESDTPWCYEDDQLTMGALSSLGITVGEIDRLLQRRILHNIHDISEYLMLGFSETHAADDKNTIYEKVYADIISSFDEGEMITPQVERAFWSRVIYVLLMTGNFYIEV